MSPRLVTAEQSSSCERAHRGNGETGGHGQRAGGTGGRGGSVAVGARGLTAPALRRPWVLRLVALALAAVSVCVIFAEATIGAGRHPDLSPFSIMVHHKANRAEIGLQLLALLPLVSRPPPTRDAMK